MKTITLKHSVKGDSGQVISSLTIRQPLVRDVLHSEKKYPKDEVAKEISLAAALCNVSEEVIEKLYLSDYKEVQKVLQKFCHSESG